MHHCDRLGKVIKVYRRSMAAGVTIAVLVCLACVGVLLYCLFHRPYPFKIMLAGVALVVAGPVRAVSVTRTVPGTRFPSNGSWKLAALRQLGLACLTRIGVQFNARRI